MVSNFFDQPEMTKRWSRVVKKTEWYKIGHVTYLFDGNFMLNPKIMSKMMFGLTSDDQSVIKSGQEWSKNRDGRKYGM